MSNKGALEVKTYNKDLEKALRNEYKQKEFMARKSQLYKKYDTGGSKMGLNKDPRLSDNSMLKTSNQFGTPGNEFMSTSYIDGKGIRTPHDLFMM